jgi:hypothetical protein
MSNQISELYKVLNNDEKFLKYTEELKLEPTQEQSNVLIDKALNDEELMKLILPIIDDIEIIKSKMQIRMTQTLKTVNKNKVEIKKDDNEEIVEEKPFENKYEKIEGTPWIKMTTSNYSIIY